jgi:hypothetical protein
MGWYTTFMLDPQSSGWVVPGRLTIMSPPTSDTRNLCSKVDQDGTLNNKTSAREGEVAQRFARVLFDESLHRGWCGAGTAACQPNRHGSYG